MAIDFTCVYTFSQYFEMQIPVNDLVSDFGYIYRKELLNAPITDSTTLGNLDVNRLIGVLKRTRSVNESTKREVIITQVVQELVLLTDTYLRIEAFIQVSPQLQGVLDYLISRDHHQELLVIEAKRNDLDYGFTQLAAQMIALDQWNNSPDLNTQPILWGVVTTGDVWKFGYLNRSEKQITEALNLYTVPDDLTVIMGLLRQALNS